MLMAATAASSVRLSTTGAVSTKAQLPRPQRPHAMLLPLLGGQPRPGQAQGQLRPPRELLQGQPRDRRVPHLRQLKARDKHAEVIACTVRLQSACRNSVLSLYTYLHVCLMIKINWCSYLLEKHRSIIFVGIDRVFSTHNILCFLSSPDLTMFRLPRYSIQAQICLLIDQALKVYRFMLSSITQPSKFIRKDESHSSTSILQETKHQRQS